MLSVSLYMAGCRDVSPQPTRLTESHIQALVQTPPKAGRSKHSTPCWSPALYSPGARRCNANVEAVSALVYDFDHTTLTPQDMHDKLNTMGLSHFIHTSWSHTSSASRFRVCVLLSRPLLPHEFNFAWAQGGKVLGIEGEFDIQTKDISRHYILPVARGGLPYQGFLALNLKPLDVSRLSGKQNQKSNTAAPAGKPAFSEALKLKLDTGEEYLGAEMALLDPGKYKCFCPFEDNSSAGSAFIRVCKDGRVLLLCTSQRHTHEGKRWWLTKEKGSSGRSLPPKGSPERMTELLSQVPQDEQDYVAKHLAYCAPQGAFYWHNGSGWQVEAPWRYEGVTRHIIGRLPSGLSTLHVEALLTFILRRQVMGFGYAPGSGPVFVGSGERLLNLYSTPSLERVRAPFPRVQQMLDVLCGGDPKAIRWLVHWSAALVQHPDRRSQVAVLSISPQQGIGKSMYGNLLKVMIGEGNVAVVSNRALRDNFNASYSTRLLVLADEVGIGSDAKDVLAELKSCITDERVHHSAPYAARTSVENRMSWWMTSNEPRPLLLEEDDRRFTVLRASKTGKAYREMLPKCFDPQTGTFTAGFRLEVSGYAAALEKLTIDWKLIARPHQSKARTMLQEASRHSISAFVSEVKTQGVSAVVDDFPPDGEWRGYTAQHIATGVPCEVLYSSYRSWCMRYGRRDTKPEAELRLALLNLPGVTTTRMGWAKRRIQAYRGLPGQAVPQGNVVHLSPGGEA